MFKSGKNAYDLWKQCTINWVEIYMKIYEKLCIKTGIKLILNNK
jgi:hypothetical protein